MRILAKNRIEVLVYRVRGAEVPVLTDAFLRVQHFDELAKLLRDDIPAHAEMAGEGPRLKKRLACHSERSEESVASWGGCFAPLSMTKMGRSRRAKPSRPRGSISMMTISNRP